MNRDEILKELNYHGEYTKDVKKRLKKLLKKYHPDNNSEDKDTILILYDIKKQLEEGTLKNYSNNSNKNNSKSSKNNSNFTAVEKRYIYFLENMISALQKKKEEINKKINSLYRRLNKNIDIKNKVQNELGRAEFDVEDLQVKMIDLTKVTMLDKLFIVLIIILWISSLIFNKIILLITSVVFIILEIYYIHIRYTDYIEKTKILQKYKKDLENVNDKFNNINSTVEQLQKEETELKKEKLKINNDIQFYSHEINKIKDKKNNRSKGMDRSGKTYEKR